MTRTGDREIGVVSGRLPDNPGGLACMLLCSYILIGNRVRVKSLGVAPGLANARPLGSVKFQMPHPRD